MKYPYLFLIPLCSLLFYSNLFAQSRKDSSLLIKDTTTQQIETDTSQRGFLKSIIHYFKEAKKDKSQKKFDISFIGGPNYSVDTKLGIGLLGSGIYRLDKKDMTLPPSDVSIYTNITTSGFFAIGIDGNTIFPEDKYRINYDTYFAYMPKYYYGIGYEAGKANVSTKFDKYTLSAQADFLRKIFHNAYAGLTVTAQNVKGKHFQKEELKPEQSLNNTIVGGGIIFTYDSRDFIPNPFKGWYLKYKQNFFLRALGTNHPFNRIEFTARTYQKIWKKGILAFDLEGTFNNGNVPWNLLSDLGSSRQMRGYYSGQYRDKKQINTQVELRQKIKNRHGFVVWFGIGKVFDSFENWKWHHILPTYGIGYRWEFKHRVNIRLDYGIGSGQSGFYFNVNEAF